MPEPDNPKPSDAPVHHLRVVPLRDPGGRIGRAEADPERLGVAFAPIADLRRGVAAGHELLLAEPGGEPATPRGWSAGVHPAAASRLEAALLRRGLAERERLPPDAFLMVTVSAAALGGEEAREAIADAGRLERTVFAVADDGGEEVAYPLRRTLDAVREAGGLVAVDEAGSGYASLRQLVALRPDFVRIGGELVLELDRDQAKAAVVETVGALASRIDAWVIAGNVTSPPELTALRRLGVPLAQGPCLGGPGPAMAPLAGDVAEMVGRAAPPEAEPDSVAGLVEQRPALPWGGSLEDVADAFLEDPRHDVVVLVDERNRPLALAERAALLRGEPFERPVMRVTPGSPLKAVARRAAARPLLERFHPLVVCDPRGVYLGIVRVEQLLDALARD